MPFVDTSQIEPITVLPGWSGRFVHSENMTFIYFEAEDGAQAVHEHEHLQEEVWNVIEGEIEVTIGGVKQIAGPLRRHGSSRYPSIRTSSACLPRNRSRLP